MPLAYLSIVSVAILAAAIACFQYLNLIPAIFAVIIGAPLALALAITLYGLSSKTRGLDRFDAQAHARAAALIEGEGRHITTADGRIVEYLVYGSNEPTANVIVQMHGSGSSAGIVCRMNALLCEELNLKGIAPSMPNHGYSDVQIARRIVDFPRDVEAILEAEGVEQFMVEGTSFGTAHAMAMAWYFGPDRCVAMGLNVPFVSDPIDKAFDLGSRADAIPRFDPDAWYHAWTFFVADLMYRAAFISPPLRHMARAYPELKKVAQERPWIMDLLLEDQRRLVARGAQGQGWEQFSFEVGALWGFDPREIETRNVAVWYAEDDSLLLPSHGEWLADHFRTRTGVKTSIRVENTGFGHFTYLPSHGPAFQGSERTIPQTLLDLCDDAS